MAVPPNPSTPSPPTSDHKVAELKRKKLNIPELEDAKDAGGACSKNCTLILTKGYSAEAFAMTGLSLAGRDKYGVFPLKGKLLNVRRASLKRSLKDTNIQKIMDILGLQYGKIYEDAKELRYGHLMIMADQDHDGSHFKGLLINFLHYFWPSLLKKVPNFVRELITPIVKASNNKTNKEFLFYTIPEYDAWKEGLGNKLTEYTIKYYEGLATFGREEAESYFAHLDQHIKDFFWVDDEDGAAIELAFSKKNIETIKDWLRAPQASTDVDSKAKRIRYRDFINKYVAADLQRSIPSMVDGLKPVQRKILFCAFKKPIFEKIRVDRFIGYVLDSAYHHAEATLVDNIIDMAQNFVGSNNINLLQPIGNFGTRKMGGKDHVASGIYLSTQLSPITRYIFHEDDELLLNYLNDGGQSIEPEWFIPIIPMVLVNGSKARKFSSFIPNYHPRDIIANLKRLLKREEMVSMRPWYKWFKGDIQKTSSKEYTTTGIITGEGKNDILITELPVGTWTQDYMKFLEAASQDGKDIKAYTARSDDTTVHFKITTEDQMNSRKGLWKKFNLTTKLSTANMHLFNAYGELKKYDTPEQILEEFFTLRLDFYENRKTALLRQFKKDILLLKNKLEFIKIVTEGKIDDFYAKPKAVLCAELKAKGLLSLLSIEKKADHVTEETKEEEEVAPIEESNDGTGYDYLLDLGIALGGQMKEFNKESIKKNEQFKNLFNTTTEALWLKDLEALDRKLDADGEYRLEEYAIAEHMANINFQSSHDDEESSPEIAEAPKKKALAKRERDAAIAARLERENKKRRILVSDYDEEEPENDSDEEEPDQDDSDEEEPEDDSDEEEPEDDNDVIEDSDFEDEE